MKRIPILIATVILLLLVQGVKAQQGIGTNTPDKSAAVDILSNSRGLLIPRVNLTSTTVAAPILTPVTDALMVYNLNTAGDVKPGFYYWKKDSIIPANSKWVRLASANEEPWNLQATTIPAADNNQNIYQKGNVGIGDFSASNVVYQLDVNGMLNQTTTTSGRTNKLHSGNNLAGQGINGVGISSQNGAGPFNFMYVGDSSPTGGAVNTTSMGITNFSNRNAFFNAFESGTNYILKMGTSNLTESTDVEMDANHIGFNANNGVNNQNFTINPTDILASKYPNTRNDITADPLTNPINFLYTNDSGKFLSAPLSAINTTASNGLIKSGNNIKLGGNPLSEATVITTDAANTLAIAGLQPGVVTGLTPDKIVVADPTTGVLKQVDRSSFDADLRLIGDSHITQDAGIGSNGTAIGGNNHIAIGANTLTDPTSAANANVAIGANSLEVAQNGFNVGLGFGTGSKLTGNSSSNSAIGTLSLKDLVNGDFNVALGFFAGMNLTAGNNNIFLGNQTAPNVSNTASNQLNIGNWIYGDNGNIGIGKLVPSNKLEITSAAANTSGLTFTNLTNVSPVTAVAAPLGVDVNGKVVTIAASTSAAIRTEPADYTALTTDETILVDATSGLVKITLPAATLVKGKRYNVKKIDASANGAQVISAGGTIDANAAGTGVTTTLSWQGWVFQSDGSNWYIISRI